MDIRTGCPVTIQKLDIFDNWDNSASRVPGYVRVTAKNRAPLNTRWSDLIPYKEVNVGARYNLGSEFPSAIRTQEIEVSIWKKGRNKYGSTHPRYQWGPNGIGWVRKPDEFICLIGYLRTQKLATDSFLQVCGFALKMIQNGYPDSSSASSSQAENSRNTFCSLEKLIPLPPAGVRPSLMSEDALCARPLRCMPVFFQIAHKLLEISRTINLGYHVNYFFRRFVAKRNFG